MKFLKSTRPIVLMATLLGVGALANDTAIYSVPVQGIDPMDSKLGTTLVKFYGQQAGDFMKLLPPVATVPPYAELVAKHEKSLRIASKKYELRFYCADAKIEHDGGDEGPLVAKPLPKGATCEIALGLADDESDSMNFNSDGGIEKVVQQLSGN